MRFGWQWRVRGLLCDPEARILVTDAGDRTTGTCALQLAPAEIELVEDNAL